ncbi:hypothetical protein [Kribbella jiaozuonensis]|uniref:hypothetical protein n=1 Tax=Kribbella jiaozuonensis TaxID=2575441 RepID=UPI00148528E1|nr:hypothetical protein [Kribbella jiaozuonensis]
MPWKPAASRCDDSGGCAACGGGYEPIWKYNYKVLAKDLTAHLTYGLTTAAAYKIFRRA